MKTSITIHLATIGASCLLLSAAAQPADQPLIARTEGQFVASTAIASHRMGAQALSSSFLPPAQATGRNQNDLNMNFVNAPLEQVLDYLSDSAGFIVVQQTPVSGYVTIKGNHITKNQAVDLLNNELNRNNYAAIRENRTLTIMNKRDAKMSRIPVLIGNNPTNIPNTDEIATWIIPIRFVEARQLMSDLSLFVSAQATVIANEAANSIVITDTQANIRHLVRIIQVVDGSAEAETEIRVFPLKYASPVDVANELSSMFPSSSSSDSQSPVTFGGPPGGPGGGFTPFSGDDGTTASSSQQRIQKAKQVTAVADSRIQAVIVTAPKDLMTEIAGIMTELDVPSDRDETVATIQLQNADPQQVAQVLQDMFGSSSTSGSSQNSALQQRSVNGVTTMGQTTTSSSLGSSSSSSGGGSRTGAAN
ncbi:MAG TPA: secretin N-terminal domain-containing protein [Verrucomicrobiae bacterium]